MAGPTIYKPKEMVPSKEQSKSEIPKEASDAQIAFQVKKIKKDIPYFICFLLDLILYHG